MMKTIYKVELQIDINREVWMEIDHEILSVHEQHGKIYLWYMCDSTLSKTPNRFSVFGTGGDIPTPQRERHFIGTVHKDNGNVWHVFQER